MYRKIRLECVSKRERKEARRFSHKHTGIQAVYINGVAIAASSSTSCHYVITVTYVLVYSIKCGQPVLNLRSAHANKLILLSYQYHEFPYNNAVTVANQTAPTLLVAYYMIVHIFITGWCHSTLHGKSEGPYRNCGYPY